MVISYKRLPNDKALDIQLFYMNVTENAWTHFRIV